MMDKRIKDCVICGGTGLDISISGRRIKVCQCVEEMCECGGSAPYYLGGTFCKCKKYRTKAEVLKCRYKEADIPEKFRWKSIKDIAMKDKNGKNTAIGNIYNFITLIYEDWYYDPVLSKNNKKGFYFHGRPGTGKTLLGSVILNEIILKRDKKAKFISLSKNYFMKLRDTFNKESENYGQTYPIIEGLSNYDVLLLDDFGVNRLSEWEQNVLYQLIDARYLGEKITLFTSNNGIDKILDISSGRIRSRILEMCTILEFSGDDYRERYRSAPNARKG